MNVRRVAGGVVLPEHNARWTFVVQGGGVIVGRREDAEGVLCIRHAASNTLSGPLTHEYCLETARRMLNVPDGPIDGLDALESPTGPYGAATFVGAADVRRVWYCSRAPGLIVGVHICPNELARAPVYNLIRGECRRIMAGAVFDRPSWGGDDPLTRVLIEEPDAAADEESDRPDDGQR